MFAVNKEIKKIESKEKATNQLKELTGVYNDIEKTISKYYVKAKEVLLRNDEESFEIIANSIFYYQDVQRVLQIVMVRFETYLISFDTMYAINGIRSVLKSTAKMMTSFPSISANNKDFKKFKRAMLRGQLNMKAMTSMMREMNPGESSPRSNEELSALKERILMGENKALNVDTNSRIKDNEDFFQAINKE